MNYYSKLSSGEKDKNKESGNCKLMRGTSVDESLAQNQSERLDKREIL
jgi:hypothetical protein